MFCLRNPYETRADSSLFAVILTGCAIARGIDSNVNTFSRRAAIPVHPTYRFERLPSQQANEARQQRLEALAGPALEHAGLRRGAAAARHSVQIDARVATELSSWADPWMDWSPGFGWNMRYGPAGHWAADPDCGGWSRGFAPATLPRYGREVSIVLRELSTGRVVYETRARNAGPYAATDAVLPALFEASLDGFPNPPPGERRVNV